MSHHQPGLGTLTTGFHLAYPGYTGGLVIGGYGSSGLAWIPERPKKGFETINVFCAQDESIWDRGEKREYSYGWSENFGTGPDGQRLEYVSGRVVEASRERVVLTSINRGGCYEVRKAVTTSAKARFWITQTRITNRCDHGVKFDFFSGDDPWIGTYKSSDGDVGWVPGAFVRNEQAFERGDFTSGGLVDLGNERLGQKEGSFSNQADFFALDPTLPLPDLATFANRFAHDMTELEPSRPLDNRTMTALNLGWLGRELAPNQSMDVAFALGLAEEGNAVNPPRVPAISDADWSSWRKLEPPRGGDLRDNIDFASELVELRVTPNRLEVHGTYYLFNPTSASVTIGIEFPVGVTDDRPPPESIRVDGRAVALSRGLPRRIAGRFQVFIPPQSVKSFVVDYSQLHRGRSAEYIVTSARSWKRPIARAVFRVTAAPELGKLRISYPARASVDSRGWRVYTMVAQPFLPDREMTLTW